MRRTLASALVPAVILSLAAVRPCAGRTSNGNDFALFLSEARTDAELAELLADALGRPHSFRYLRIVTVEDGERDGRPYMALDTVEPSSDMHVAFSVTKTVSLAKLREPPHVCAGDAIAVKGVVERVDHARKTIRLERVIVNHRDRLTPKVGQELAHEINPRAVYYTYTGGKRPVHLMYRDRDLLKDKDEVIKRGGRQAWADFLEAKLAEREAARARTKGTTR